MVKSSIKRLATIGIVCSSVVSATAAPNSAPGPSVVPVFPNTNNQIFSKLSATQIKDHVSSRYFLSDDFGRSIDSDPNYPGRSRPNYSFFGYEYFPNYNLSYGFVLPYTYENLSYSRFRGNNISKIISILPYISYLITPRWLLTAQIQGNIENYKYVDFTYNPIYRFTRQAFTIGGSAYATWIAPHNTFTYTLRGGVINTNQRFRSAIDNYGNFFPTRHYENTAFSFSSRLKYFPNNDIWNAFIHLQADFRVHQTQRPYAISPNSGTQTRMFLFGPGMHYNINKTWEVRVMALHTVGFGYTKENRIGIRLRAAI
jgi:hypothetical protein